MSIVVLHVVEGFERSKLRILLDPLGEVDDPREVLSCRLRHLRGEGPQERVACRLPHVD